MNQPATVADYRHINAALFFGTQSPEKRLIVNLAEQANTIIERDGFSDEVKGIVQAIATLKHN